MQENFIVCQQCGEKNQIAANFCTKCAYKLKEGYALNNQPPVKKGISPFKVVLLTLGVLFMLFVFLIILAIALSGDDSPSSSLSSNASDIELSSADITPTIATTPTPTLTPEPTRSIEQIKKDTVVPEYKEYARNPEKYIDNSIRITGEVLQVLDNGSNLFTLRVAQDNDYDQVWLVTYILTSENSRLLEGDNVTLYGMFNGLESYTSSMNVKITIPGMTSVIVDIN